MISTIEALQLFILYIASGYVTYLSMDYFGVIKERSRSAVTVIAMILTFLNYIVYKVLDWILGDRVVLESLRSMLSLESGFAPKRVWSLITLGFISVLMGAVIPRLCSFQWVSNCLHTMKSKGKNS